MNYTKYIAVTFGIVLGITSFTYKAQIIDFIAKDKVSITASINISTKNTPYRRSFLKRYHPIQLTIENTSNKEYILRSEDISLPHHSFKVISRLNVLKLLVIPIFTISPFKILIEPTIIASLLVSNLYTLVELSKNNKMKKHIKKIIFEPGETLSIPPCSKTTKTLFCPKKEFTDSFEVTTTEKETGKQNTVQLSLTPAL